MALKSKLMRGDERLEACLVSDPAHVLLGAVGAHVDRIQTAIIALDGATIDANERSAKRYGPSTAAAVKAYKQKRDIVNRRYQSRADDIVGKMTIARLDEEMALHEKQKTGSDTCALTGACPCDVRSDRPPASGASVVRRSLVGARPDDDDALKMQLALKASRTAVQQATQALHRLQLAILRSKLPLAPPLSPAEQKVNAAVIKWLNVDPRRPLLSLPTIGSAISLMVRSLGVRTSTGAIPDLRRVPDSFFAQVRGGDPDLGVECGESFFAFGGANCRRDVITHEFFHFLGVKHGGSALDQPTTRTNITTPAVSLDSADNLAQLVAEIVTPTGATDACARQNE